MNRGHFAVILSLLSAAAATATQLPEGVVSNVVEHQVKHSDGKAAFSFDASALHMDTRALPIGVFDSGIGGLTVLEAILSLDAFNNDTLQPGADGRPDFEHERFIYLGDQANMPYGNYASAGKTDYLRELILKDAVFLLGRRAWPSADAKEPVFDKPPVKAIVIACNTATAYGLDDIRAALKAWNLTVPVIGVVEAGARGVNEITRDEQAGTVAVLATVGTCKSEAYPKAIGRAVGLAGKKVPSVVQQGCVELAGAIEGDPAFAGGIENYVRADVRAVMEAHRAARATTPVSTVVLGCTHFPLVRGEIESAFSALRAQPEFSNLIAERIAVVNPAELTAKELFRSLASARLRLKPGEYRAAEAEAFYISVANPVFPGVQLAPDGSLDKDYKYSRDHGRLNVEDTRIIPMRAAALPAPSLNLIRAKLPEVSKRLR